MSVESEKRVLTVFQNPALGAENAGATHSPVSMAKSWKSQENI